jgi:hypothetical protein
MIHNILGRQQNWGSRECLCSPSQSTACWTVFASIRCCSLPNSHITRRKASCALRAAIIALAPALLLRNPQPNIPENTRRSVLPKTVCYATQELTLAFVEKCLRMIHYEGNHPRLLCGATDTIWRIKFRRSYQKRYWDYFLIVPLVWDGIFSEPSNSNIVTHRANKVK